MFIFFSLFLTITFFNTNISMAVDPDPAGKDSTDPGSQIADVLCNVIKIAQGNVGKTISILVIISIAIGLFLGKITWGVAIAVSVGLGVLFGANSVVDFIASGSEQKGGSGPCPKDPSK